MLLWCLAARCCWGRVGGEVHQPDVEHAPQLCNPHTLHSVATLAPCTAPVQEAAQPEAALGQARQSSYPHLSVLKIPWNVQGAAQPEGRPGAHHRKPGPQRVPPFLRSGRLGAPGAALPHGRGLQGARPGGAVHTRACLAGRQAHESCSSSRLGDAAASAALIAAPGSPRSSVWPPAYRCMGPSTCRSHVLPSTCWPLQLAQGRRCSRRPQPLRLLSAPDRTRVRRPCS